MLSDCGVGENSWESIGQQGDQTNQSKRKSTFNIRWNHWCWNSNTWPIWYEEPTHWKRHWCWERLRAGGNGATEDETVGWHHWLNGHESESTLRDSVGQRSLVCCSPWGHSESDMTQKINILNDRILTLLDFNLPTTETDSEPPIWHHCLRR